MDQILDDFIEEPNEVSDLTDKEVFTLIWTSPRRVFRFIEDTHYDKYFRLLMVFAGISRAFDRASMKNFGDQFDLLPLIAICVVAGGLVGWVTYYFYAALMSWTGKWLNGKANTDSLLRMLAYAMIPAVVALVFLIPEISVYGIAVFQEYGDLQGGTLPENIIFWTSMAMELVLGIWTLVLCVIGVSEIQQFSIGKAILNMLLPVLVIVIPIMLFVMVADIL